MDPLANIHDIQLPTEIHNYPIAPGWWLLLILSLLLIVISVKKIRQFLLKRKAKKTALKQLKLSSSISQSLIIIKWVLIAYFPRQRVAHLSGTALEKFLTQCLTAKHQATFIKHITLENKTLFNCLYQNDEQLEPLTTQFNQALLFWLNNALPPKKLLLSKITTENNSPNKNSVNENGGTQ